MLTARILIVLVFVDFLVLSVSLNQIKVDPSTISALVELTRTVKNDSNVMKFLANIQKNFIRAAIKGLTLGTLKTEKRMELNLLKLFSDFVLTSKEESLNIIDFDRKIKKIEDTMIHDKQSIMILSNAMDLVKKVKNIREYRQTMKNLSKNTNNKADHNCKRLHNDKLNEYYVEKLIMQLQERIKQHFISMREKVYSNNHHFYSNLNSPKTHKMNKKLSILDFMPTNVITLDEVQLKEISTPQQILPQLYVRTPINNYFSPIHQPTSSQFESFYRYQRQTNNEEKKMKVKQSEDEEELDDEFLSSNGNGDGGLLGIIAGLSSPEGADVGALAGLISTVVTNLLGPDGLDIPSLLSTGTSLIAGLLSGDENFGKVVASYIGIAIEGITGGGGAENNGIFFGNFVGTFFNYLFADPEEEGGPKPEIFFQKFKEGFDQTKQKRGTDEITSTHGLNKSYFFEFISNIISSLVGGVTNFVLNASVGSSGGSSKGSADLSAGSSQESHSGLAYASGSSTSKVKNDLHSQKQTKI